MTKQDTRFKPGQTPWNKGKPYRPGGRCAETQFKAGWPAHQAHNYRPIGSLRINADGYLERKVTDDPSVVAVRRWVYVHRLLWQEAHGPIPAGMIVVFKPGTRTTELEGIRLENLEMISRQELIKRNSVHRHGPEIAALSQLRGALVRQINHRAKSPIPTCPRRQSKPNAFTRTSGCWRRCDALTYWGRLTAPQKRGGTFGPRWA